MRSRWRSRSVGSRSIAGRRRARPATGFLLAAVVVLAPLVGCGEKDPTPDQVRREARQQLVQGGATAAQARCITDRISDDLLETLSTGGTVDRDSKDFEAYSDAVVACSSAK